MTDEPESPLPPWTNFLGGPVRYDRPEETGPAPPPLEPAAESPTLQRLRAEVRKINRRYRRP